MKKILTLLLTLYSLNALATSSSNTCEKWHPWSTAACKRLHAILHEGSTDLYLSGYAWHNRYTYTPQKIRSFNENAWGGGFGKSMYDEKGNWHSLYFMAFLDSHSHVQPLGGYSWQKIFRPTENVRLGAGFTAFLTSRVDIYQNIPFPGVVPLVTVGYKQVTLNAIYIPGARGAGNVLFLAGRYTFEL